MEGKKLVYFDPPVDFGGSRNATVFLCDGLKKRGDDVYVIDMYGVCRPYIDALSEKNIPTYVLAPDAKSVIIGHRNNPWKRVWSALRQVPTFLKLRSRLIKKILEIDPDAISTSESKAHFFLGTSFRLRKYPIVMHVRGWFLRHQLSGWKRWLIKHRTDGILAVSNATAKAMVSWGVPEENIHVVFDALDYEQVVRESKKGVCSEVPVKQEAFKILVPGTLLQSKGQHTAIQAAGLLKEKGLDFMMWIAGGAAASDTIGYSNYLQRLIQDNGLEENVFLLGWRKDIYTLMRMADAVALPTHTEGFPLVVLETMTLKCPVVSTPVGGIVDIIEDGETGLLGPVDDQKVLAENIEKLIRDKDLADRIARKAYQQITEKFTFANYIESVRKAFEQIINKKRKMQV
jgi:glycosyltransferase involved in cell wall biosynthesis